MPQGDSLRYQPRASEESSENIQNYLPDFPFDLRQGSGISVLDPGDGDTVIIAGMGGNLILDILLDNPEKTFSISRFILSAEKSSGAFAAVGGADAGIRDKAENCWRKRMGVCARLSLWKMR